MNKLTLYCLDGMNTILTNGKKWIGNRCRKIADSWSPIPREPGLLVIGGPFDGKRVPLDQPERPIIYMPHVDAGYMYFAESHMAEQQRRKRLLRAAFHA